MHNLLLFIRKHWFVVLFLLLETVSFVMVSKSYSYHRSLAFNTINDLTGGIFSTYANISDYLALKQANDSLHKENAALRNQLKTSYLITDTGFTYKDTLYRYIPAHVVSISVNHSANYIMLNKGSLHGIQKEMSVISSSGIAGIIIGVSKHYSLAMSLLNHNAKISGRIKKNGLLVSIIWDTDDYRFGKILDIPSHVTLNKGDTIVTSGISMIFPQGLMIGTVEKSENNHNLDFSEGILRFATNFNNLQQVYIVDNLLKNEQEALMKEGDE